jgi:flagellar motor switch protein FliM
MNGLMGSQLLSPDEVDALLQGQPEPSEANGGAGAAATAAAHIALSATERQWRTCLPVLARINQHFARQLQEALPTLLRRQPKIRAEAPQWLRFGDFLGALTMPSSFNVVAFKPLRGQALIVCEPSLVFAAVEGLFGGNGQFQTQLEGRDFSATEQRVVQRLLALVMGHYAQAWAHVLPLAPALELALVRSEMQPDSAAITAAAERVISLRFNLEMADASGSVGPLGTLSFCLPCCLLEPLRPALLSTAARPNNTAPTAAGPPWGELLKQVLQAAPVELVAELAQTSATVQQLMALKPGDFIELDLHPRVRAHVNGVPVLEGHYGISNNRYALQVEQLIQHAGQPWLTEKQHAP